MRILSYLFSSLLVLAIGCSSNKSAKNSTAPYPNSEEGVKQIAAVFMKGGSEADVLLKSMEPDIEDCKAIVINEDDAKKLAVVVAKMYLEANAALIAPKEGQTEILVRHTTAENLKARTDMELPGGYTTNASKFKDGLHLYGFKFVKPGEKIGMAYDGLYYVNNKWVFIPKTWRYLE